MQIRPLTIGICGGSGAGKTTLADELCRCFPTGLILRIPHDAYYRDLSDMEAPLREKMNFDHPDALETEALVRDLEALRQGKPVRIPEYDFFRHRRVGERPVEPAAVVLLEGILILAETRLRSLLDIKVFVQVDEDIRLSRRLERDIRERGRDLDSVLAQYYATVRPMHRAFVQPSCYCADLVLLDSRNQVAVELLAARIREHLSAGSCAGNGSDE
ncbi:MAG TPA: uridine kinase [Candidatus Aminicenantes bacterium]|nr:uridine kinase [Candidatus Aminicenantes bacterium]